MKVTFLGSADGIPSAERFCSSTMIETNGCIYLIDAGAPVVDSLLRHGKHPNDLKAIFLTHYHGDHCDGMLSLLGLTGWAYRSASYDIFATEQIIIDTFTACSEATAGKLNKERVRFRLAELGQVYKDENIKVTYYLTHHCAPHPCYSILVECEGKKLYFSGDLSVNLAKNDFPQYVLDNHVDLFVLELAHFKFDVLQPYLPLIKVNEIYFNHANPAYLNDVICANETETFPFKLHIAKDNDVITL